MCTDEFFWFFLNYIYHKNEFTCENLICKIGMIWHVIIGFCFLECDELSFLEIEFINSNKIMGLHFIKF